MGERETKDDRAGFKYHKLWADSKTERGKEKRMQSKRNENQIRDQEGKKGSETYRHTMLWLSSSGNEGNVSLNATHGSTLGSLDLGWDTCWIEAFWHIQLIRSQLLQIKVQKDNWEVQMWTNLLILTGHWNNVLLLEKFDSMKANAGVHFIYENTLLLSQQRIIHNSISVMVKNILQLFLFISI